MASLITFANASLGYGTTVILRGITFTVDTGEYFGIVGPNGAGKTTIVRTILGTLRPLGGTVTVARGDGVPVRFGYVPQRDTVDYVLPYTAADVVMMGRFRRLGILRRPGKDDREAVARSLTHVGMIDLGGRPFKDLSGGQKQRALIARALASEPDVLVLDEPTNGMDLASRISILDLIRDLHDEEGLTVLLVSHLLDDVANHVSRLAVVERDMFSVGSVNDVLTGENLSTMYKMHVDVQQVNGRTVIMAGDGHGSN
jgi:manganese/iron transport system ATP-binding protein